MSALITATPVLNAIIFTLIFSVAALIGAAIVFKVFRIRYQGRKAVINLTIGHLKRPIIFLLIILSVRISLLFAPNMNEYVFAMTAHITGILIIIAVSWLLIKSADVFTDVIELHFDVSKSDNLRARKVHTQLKMLKRVILVLVCFIGLAAILMTFQMVRQLGAGLLASAGIVGIVVGVAAQKTLHNFISGIQIAITQPIRLDDVVIVENEWGRIEDITLTYVVVRIWDQRRLILPVTYFIEQPFQNWTTKTSDLLAPVYLYTDYTIPVDEVRAYLQTIVADNPKWDGRVCVLQVTNATEKTMEVRALVSASDAGTAWELKCMVREQLLSYIQKNFPGSLPRVRAEFNGDVETAADTQKNTRSPIS